MTATPKCAARRATSRTCRSTGCCTRGRCWPPRRTRGSPASTAAPRWRSRASWPCSPPPTCRSPAAPGRTAEPLAREEIVWSGQPVALVIAESEAAAEDGAALVVVDADPLPAVLDIEAALAAGAPPVARDRAGGGGRRRRGRPHRRRRNRRGGEAAASRRRRTRPTSPCASASTAATSPPDSSAPTPSCPAGSGPAGSTRRTSSRSRRWRGSSPTASSSSTRSTQGAFMAREALANVAGAPDRPRPGQGRADRRRVRRQADDLRAAGGRGRAQAQAAGPDRVRPRGRNSRPPTRRPAN